MRPIEFRQWLKMRKRMHYGIGIVTDGHWAGPPSVTFSEDPLMMYTGLIDKNGIKIWEEDLIQNESGRICRVVWFSPAGMWDASPVNDLGTSQGFRTDQWKFNVVVVGNIHQNPPLTGFII